MFSALLICVTLGVHLILQASRVGVGAVARELDRRLDRGLRLGPDRRDLQLAQQLQLQQPVLETRDWVALLPFVDLLLGAIEVAVAFGVAAPAICFGLDQRWATATAGARHGCAGGGV